MLDAQLLRTGGHLRQMREQRSTGTVSQVWADVYVEPDLQCLTGSTSAVTYEMPRTTSVISAPIAMLGESKSLAVQEASVLVLRTRVPGH